MIWNFTSRVQESVKSFHLFSEKHTKAEENNFSLFQQNLIASIWTEGGRELKKKSIFQPEIWREKESCNIQRDFLTLTSS